MSQVIDLAQWRDSHCRGSHRRDAEWSDGQWSDGQWSDGQGRDASPSLSHPAGVALPLEDRGDADFLIPELRSAIGSGRYCGDVIRALPDAVRSGDRVLVIGSGLGILSTLVARTAGVAKVIAIEPNVALASYMDDVHKANGVPWVETLNAVPTGSGQGRVPLFVRHDVRHSSLHPDDGPWRRVMLVPAVNLGLILGEERISLVVGESASLAPDLLSEVQGGTVERVVLGCHLPGAGDRIEPTASLAAEGFRAERSGAALVLERAGPDGAQAGPEAGAAGGGWALSGTLA